jgi:predicted kinase
LIATGGGVASGKSTFAKAVARLLAAPRIVGDRVRRLLLEQESGVHELAGSDEIGELIYAGLLSRASSALSAGRSVVLDACFPRASRRAAAAELAAKHAARFLFVHCHAPVADIIARLRLRDVRDGVAPGSWEALAASVEAQWGLSGRGFVWDCRETRLYQGPWHHRPLSQSDLFLRFQSSLPCV